MKSFPFIMREKKFYLKILKGTVSRDFRPFCFWLKRFDLDPSEQAKMISQNFMFSRSFSIAKFENWVSAKSMTTGTHVYFFRYGDFHIFILLLLDM